MKKCPAVWLLADVVKPTNHGFTFINGKAVPARPMGLDTIPARFRAAWLVFTGKADALICPGGQ